MSERKSGEVWGISDDPFASKPASTMGRVGSQGDIGSKWSPGLTATDADFACVDSPAGFPMSQDELAAYAYFYKLADPSNKSTVQPPEAVAFLSKSRLPQNVLSEIWLQSDADHKGYLTQIDFLRALKLIALAQSGKSPNIAHLTIPTPIPIFEGVTLPNKSGNSNGVTVQPTGGAMSPHLTGNNQFVPNPLTLHRTGTSVTSHSTGGSVLTHNTGNGRVASHMTGGASSGVSGITGEERERFTAVFNSCNPSDGAVTGEAAREFLLKSSLPTDTLGKICLEWAIKDDEKAQFDQHFDTIDQSKKGYVTGQESYGLFMKAQIPQADLAKIWDLANISKEGVLKKDEFAVAMHLIRSRMAGTAVPQTLPADLVPPSLRGQPKTEAFGSNSTLAAFAQPSAGNARSSGDLDLMGELNAGALTVPSISTPVTSFEGRSLSFSKLPSAHEVADFEQRERDLANRKADLEQVKGQFEGLQPTVDELREKRAEIDAEFKTVTDKRNQLALELSQLRAVYETESQIAMETENSLRREQQMIQISSAELQQAHQTVGTLQQEKSQLEEQLGSTLADNAEMKRQVKELTDAATPLRAELEQIKNELRQQLQHRLINEQLLSSAQSDYQQIHGDVQTQQGNLEREKQRNAHFAQQAAVQASINEKEKQRLAQLKAEHDQEQIKSKAAEAAAAAALAAAQPKADPYAAFAALSPASQAAAEPAIKGISPEPTAATAPYGNLPAAGGSNPNLLRGITIDTANMGYSPTQSTPGSAKKPPPPPPSAKKPQRGEPIPPPLVDGSAASPSGKPFTSLSRNASASLLSSPAPAAPIVAPAVASSSVSSKSAKDEFDELFNMHQPSKKKSTNSLSSGPEMKNGLEAVSSGVVDPSLAVSGVSPSVALTPETPGIPSAKSTTPATIPLSTSPTKKSSNANFSLGFAPRKSQDEAPLEPKKGTASVRSLPMLDKSETEVPKEESAGPFSAPVEGNTASLADDEGDGFNAFSTAPGSLSALSILHDSEHGDSSAGPAAASADGPPKSFDQAFGVGHADQAAGFSTPAFEADFASVFPDAATTPAPPKASSQSSEPPPIEPAEEVLSASKPDMKRSDTASSISEVDIDAEMQNAFANKPSSSSPAKPPSDFDDQSFVAVSDKDFNDDAFNFDASFGGFPAPSPANDFGAFESSPFGGHPVTASPTSNTHNFEADFASAFGGSSGPAAPSGGASDPFATSDFSFGPPPSGAGGGAGANAQMSVADLDAVFGVTGGASSSETPASFEDAFGPATFGSSAFTTATSAPKTSSPARENASSPKPGQSAGAASPTKRPPPPALPKRTATKDDAEEVQQIVALGFTKEQAINALEMNEFDVAKATNYLLDA
ncbi:hypothetical protein HKX48_008428 [Thoreauomyces humboldtii]|nr:hypothetical protein HKX48_008428 [Thoreauomyces humboldtii]